MKHSIFISLLFFVGCATVTPSNNQAGSDDSATASDSESTDWISTAYTTDNLITFVTATTNLAQAGNDSGIKAITDLTEIISKHLNGPLGGTNEANKHSQLLEEYIAYHGSVCADSATHEWTLVEYRLTNDSKAQLYFRTENDDSLQWCRLTVKQTPKGYRITDYYNPYYGVSVSDLYDSFIVLVNQPEIRFRGSRQKGRGLFNAIDRGSEAYYTFLDDAGVDPSLPFFVRTHVILMEYELEFSELTDAIQFWVKPGELSERYAYLNLFVNLYSGNSDDIVNESLAKAIELTGDQSNPRLTAFSYYYSIGDIEKAISYLRESIVEDPNYDDNYWSYFEFSIDQGTHDTTVGILDVLQEKFGYEFERSDFENDNAYASLIESDEFNNWLTH